MTAVARIKGHVARQKRHAWFTCACKNDQKVTHLVFEMPIWPLCIVGAGTVRPHFEFTLFHVLDELGSPRPPVLLGLVDSLSSFGGLGSIKNTATLWFSGFAGFVGVLKEFEGLKTGAKRV
jgi:hypothetical protein